MLCLAKPIKPTPTFDERRNSALCLTHTQKIIPLMLFGVTQIIKTKKISNIYYISLM